MLLPNVPSLSPSFGIIFASQSDSPCILLRSLSIFSHMKFPLIKFQSYLINCQHLILSLHVLLGGPGPTHGGKCLCHLNMLSKKCLCHLNTLSKKHSI